MQDWIRSKMPSEERLRATRGLGWLAPLLARRSLWHLNRRRVAMGAAIGVFCGFLIPLAQIAGAALLALLLRANLPVAAVATFVTNPVTFAPIFVLAYKTGSALLGQEPQEREARKLEEATEGGAIPGDPEPGWIDRARAVGKPLVLGLLVFAVTGGLATWVLVHVGWIVAVRMKRRRRLRRRRP